MKNRLYLNDDWTFFEEFDESLVSNKAKQKGETVRIPHTFTVTPFNCFDAKIYQKVGLYRKDFKTESEWKDKVVLLTIEAAAHESVVYLNGEPLAQHKCGYTAFTVDLTKKLNAAGKINTLAIKVNSKENLNIPPFGNIVDYMTYGGIYRDVYIDVKNPIYIEDVFVTTRKNHFNSEITLNTAEKLEGYTISQKVVIADKPESDPVAEVYTGIRGKKTLTAAEACPCMSWSLESPVLYYLVTELHDSKDKVVDVKTVRFGFRDIRYDETGFYLNNKKIKIRGLNRHQAFPYVGYAMPKNMQIEDADILKYELGLNEVRTSHYPQSQYFVDRCDEIGLLVFTEIPGWQHIGNEEWKEQAIENVKDMIVQYRNHPSIFLWGVRINESQDDDDFYAKTNYTAHNLDASRPTAGVRFLQKSHLLEDVYTYNDFSHTGKNPGVLHKEQVTDTKKGYMVTEYNGHMYPTKSFDNESVRTEHALRHANVLDTVAEYEEISGSSGWCAFDYNTHKDFGSGDRICYHGVMDMFRNPKLAAYVYQSQQNPEIVGDVLEVNSSMDKGEYPGGTCGYSYVFTNADCVRLFINNVFIKEYSRENNTKWTHIPHGPLVINDTIGNQLVENEGVPEKYSEKIKEILEALRFYTVEDMPAKLKRSAILMNMKGIIDMDKMTQWYGKYIGNWGGKVLTFKFEAYRNGKLVKTLIRTPNSKFFVEAKARRTVLVEETTYDVASVNLFAKDEHSNLLPYCQEAVKLEATGDIELIGPSIVSLKGGMAGTYVKSKGKSGKGSLLITDWCGNSTKIDFTVKAAKKK